MQRSEFLLKACAGLSILPLAGFSGRILKKHLLRPNSSKIVKSGEGRQINVLGDKMTFKLTGNDTDRQYVLIEENNVPGVSIPMHVHENEDEIFRVIEGALEVQVGNQKIVLGPGDMAFAPRGIPHSWKVIGDEPAKVDLSIFPAGLEDMFEELGQLPEGPPDMKVVSEITGRYGVSFKHQEQMEE